MKSDHFTVIAFYEFRKIKSKFIRYKKLFNHFCNEKNIRGTIILSPEGINGTVAGLDDSISELVLFLSKLNFNKTEIKYSYTKIMPFYKLKIKLKEEIVPFANKVKNPSITGEFVKPKDWNNYDRDWPLEDDISFLSGLISSAIFVFIILAATTFSIWVFIGGAVL